MAARKSIHLGSFSHRNPIPAAARVGPLVMSGSIVPRDPQGQVPPTLQEQCDLMFRYVSQIMEQAGGTLDDIVKMNVVMQDATQRDVLNQQWVRVFPDATQRPARHTESKDLAGGVLIQCDIIGWIAR